MTANEIVNALLEYGIDPNAPPPGSPEDPWRQSGYKPLKFRRGDFEGKRPGDAPVKHGKTVPPLPTERKKIPPKRTLGGFGDRMKWKPPQE